MVLEDEGVLYLNVKTVERAHTPKNLWEKVKLPKGFAEALEAVDGALQHWPEHKVNRCKQRVVKLRQMLIRSRRLELQPKAKLVPIKKKTERRENIRELKAETAAQVDLAVEKELLSRLQQGMYGDIYNFDSEAFENVIKECDGEEEELEEEDEDELAAGSDSESEAEPAPRGKRRRLE